MKKIILLILIGLLFSGCSLFRTHKLTIDQGNVITQVNISRLHPGMTETQVKAIMGNPVLISVFSPHRLNYVYTYQEGYQKRLEKRVICIFKNGRLQTIKQD